MLPTRTNDLLQLGRQFLRTIDAHRHDLALDQFSDDLARMLQQLQDRQIALASAEHARLLCTHRLEISVKTLVQWLGRARLVMSLVAHARPSQPWGHTPVADERRSRVPKRLHDRIALARALVSFFARHPEFGVGFAEVTAAKGRSLYERVIQSDEMLRLARQECGLVRQQRNAAQSEIGAVLRRIITALQTQLNGCDTRWTDFGLVPIRSRTKRSARSSSRRADPVVFVPRSDRTQRVAAA